MLADFWEIFKQSQRPAGFEELGDLPSPQARFWGSRSGKPERGINFLEASCFSMDGYSGKRVIGGLSSSRSSSLSFRDVNHENRNSHQSCNRIGCSTRHSIQNSDPEKFKCLKPPFRFSSSSSLSASSSRLFSSSSNFRKYYHEGKNKGSTKEADAAESGTGQSAAGEDLKWESGFRGEGTGQLANHGRPMPQCSYPTSESSRGSNAGFASKFGRQINRRLGSVIQDTASSLLRRSSTPRFNASQVSKATPQGINGRPQRYSLSNLGCASISDALPSDSSGGCNTRGVSVGRKLLLYGEGSSKSVLPPPDRRVAQEVSTQMRNQYSKDAVAPVGGRRVTSGSKSGRMECSKQEDCSIQLADPFPLPQQVHAPSSIPEDIQKSSQRSLSSTEQPCAFQDSSSAGRTGSGIWSSHNRLISGYDDVDEYRRYNIEGIAEVLLALERIEQDEELTDEQLLVLEANLFLESLNFYDQHREMRLDIDSMSYEELLALEEKMGTVSTALSEEALSKCLKRSTYRSPAFTFSGISRHRDDAKCSICQEEYMAGAEVGRLPCNHRYHMECISQWLGLKNWCPICKVAAGSSTNKAQS